MSYRREFLDMVFIFNAIYGINDYNIDDVSTFIDNDLRSADQNLFALQQYLPRTENYFNFFNNRVIKIWNGLPTDIRMIELTDMGTNTGFKKQLKDYYFLLLKDKFETDVICTWTTCCRCTQCRL